MGRKLIIGSKVESEKGNFKIIAKERIPGTASYLFTLKCLDCGYVFTTRQIYRAICIQCKKNKTIQNYVGFKTDVYEILEFVEERGTSRYYRVKCLKCGTESVKSLKTIIATKCECDACKSGNHKIPTLDAPFNCVKSSYMRGAADRSLEWSLTDSEFGNLIFGDCFYCNSKPKEYSSDYKYNKTNEKFLRNGIDRLDSSKGYTVNNCVTCCDICNRMKMNMNKDDFIEHIKKIYVNLFDYSKCSQTIPIGSTSQANGDGNGVYPKEDKEIVESI